MQIVIPMTGNGSRFKAAGFERLKPFIEIHGTPMIEWVVRMFDEPSDRFMFIVRQEHLETLPYVQSELQRISHNGRIVAIIEWEKKGPVFDVLRVAEQIDDEKPVLISYCDYYMQWNYARFVRSVMAGKYDGAVPCYSGFHPHLIPKKNVYACCKVDDDEEMIAIREKFSWTRDKTQSRHSPGVYYFRNGALMKHYFARLVDADQAINGEYYSSMPYNFMVQDGLRVWCPAIVKRFCQWGTPEDLEAYLYWVDLIRSSKEATA